MTSFDLAAFEAAFPPTGIVTINGGGGGGSSYGAGAPTPTPLGVDQHITVLNMSGKRATGLWTTQQERSHFTIEAGHILNIHRSGVLPIRTIEISTGGAQPAYSNERVMPGSTIAIVLNEDGGYSPLAPIGGQGRDGGGSDGNDNSNTARRAAGTSATGYGAIYAVPASSFGESGYAPPSNGNNGGGGYGASYAAPASNGGYTPPASGGNGPLGAAYRALTNAAALSYSPFGWRV